MDSSPKFRLSDATLQKISPDVKHDWLKKLVSYTSGRRCTRARLSVSRAQAHGRVPEYEGMSPEALSNALKDINPTLAENPKKKTK